MAIVMVKIQSKAHVKRYVSNAMLSLGVLLLLIVGVLIVAGMAINPLWPAISALAIGVTAVLDRMDDYLYEERVS